MTEQMSDEMSGIVIGLIREDEAKADRAKLHELYGVWMGLCGRFHAGKMPDGEALDIERKTDLVLRDIFSIPAMTSNGLLCKIQILEYYLTDAGSNSLDNRELVMIASIKADVVSSELKHRLFE